MVNKKKKQYFHFSVELDFYNVKCVYDVDKSTIAQCQNGISLAQTFLRQLFEGKGKGKKKKFLKYKLVKEIIIV